MPGHLWLSASLGFYNHNLSALCSVTFRNNNNIENEIGNGGRLARNSAGRQRSEPPATPPGDRPTAATGSGAGYVNEPHKRIIERLPSAGGRKFKLTITSLVGRSISGAKRLELSFPLLARSWAWPAGCKFSRSIAGSGRGPASGALGWSWR